MAAEHIRRENMTPDDFVAYAKGEKVKAAVSAIIIIVADLAMYICGTTIDVDQVMQIVMGLITLGATGYGIWKNHNFTTAAADAQLVLDELKAADKS